MIHIHPSSGCNLQPHNSCPLLFQYRQGWFWILRPSGLPWHLQWLWFLLILEWLKLCWKNSRDLVSTPCNPNSILPFLSLNTLLILHSKVKNFNLPHLETVGWSENWIKVPIVLYQNLSCRFLLCLKIFAAKKSKTKQNKRVIYEVELRGFLFV